MHTSHSSLGFGFDDDKLATRQIVIVFARMKQQHFPNYFVVSHTQMLSIIENRYCRQTVHSFWSGCGFNMECTSSHQNRKVKPSQQHQVYGCCLVHGMEKSRWLKKKKLNWRQNILQNILISTMDYYSNKQMLLQITNISRAHPVRFYLLSLF